MVDFFMIHPRTTKNGVIEIYPKFILKNPSSDLMIRGGDFYAVWLEDLKLWSTSEQDLIDLIDRELDNYAKENFGTLGNQVRVLHMWDAETKMIDSWHKYCQKQMRDNYKMLDEKIIFSNHETTKDDFASKKLNYPLKEGNLEAYSKLMNTLYSPEEKRKIEWAIGSIVCGESKNIQKFLVLYGSAGTGKSTVLNIIQKLFEGYHSVFDAKALGSASSSFALEPFKTNPLVAIQHDGDLSRIEDNTRLNSLVSHELMTVNEKFKSAYSNRFKAFLFMGTNKPVQITDAKSGLIRRLIDVTPTGNKVPQKEYSELIKKIDFELGAIAWHCMQVYLENPNYYDNYKPISMMSKTNDFYNFVLENYYIFEKDDCTTLASAWKMYDDYCKEANVPYKMNRRIFKEELKNYFSEYKDRYYNPEDGTRVRNLYSGFKIERFDNDEKEVVYEEPKETYKIIFEEQPSILDELFKDCKAQYAKVVSDTGNDRPMTSWDKTTTTLSELDTSQLHYVVPPDIHHIFIDFDIKDENGNKSFEKNLEAASKWPKTYAELSKSGEGIHLHYLYSGDPTMLNRVYDEHIEVKVCTGKSSIRRKLSKCNNEPIATLDSGLPLKGERRKVINENSFQSEKGLRTTIKKNLRKEIHGATKPSMDHIKLVTDKMYESGQHYDISDLYSAIWSFAACSTNRKSECLDIARSIHYKSEDIADAIENHTIPIAFYDVEVFPNLFLVNWKLAGEEEPVHRMINPSPEEISELVLRYNLIGFNCRRYDNHIMYARKIGYSIEDLYSLSQAIITKQPNCFFGEAYNLSYTDVYDFSSKKQSLKKFEIELGLIHKELGLPWDKPVPEEKWEEVAAYCDNDVIATEAVFNARQADFLARKILADIAGMSVNTTTNTLTGRIIFGSNRTPQNWFCYRNLAEPVSELPEEVELYLKDAAPNVLNFERPEGKSLMPFFPGYVYSYGKSTYRGEEVGEGGYVYAEPGMYGNVALLDIASMHPSSVRDECLFGPDYTNQFNEILDARIAIKHKDYERAKTMFGGKLAKYLTDDKTAKDLAQALKIAINSVYGLTSAGFTNPFRDPRNVDNIVAKRGALFMIDLKHAVQEKGFIVAHIKTDSIKIPDATPEIIQFVMDFGKQYGYNFEHEATYDRMCLVNDAVYIAKYKDGEHAGEWTATGTQFQIPYVFKTLFSKEPITFDDMCEVKSVSTALYLDMNEPKIMRIYENYDKNTTDHGDNIISFSSIDTYLPLETALSDFSAFEKVLAKLKIELDDADLHDYHFVGKVGRFCPIKIGENGGLLVREKDGKYYAATGSKGYRWVESWVVQENGDEDKIDRSYYNDLVTQASMDINIHGDLEWFISDDPYIGPEFYDGKPYYPDTVPWKIA